MKFSPCKGEMGEKVDIRPFQGRVWYLIRIRRDAPDAINSVPFRDFNSRVRMRLQLNLAPMGASPPSCPLVCSSRNIDLLMVIKLK